MPENKEFIPYTELLETAGLMHPNRIRYATCENMLTHEISTAIVFMQDSNSTQTPPLVLGRQALADIIDALTKKLEVTTAP